LNSFSFPLSSNAIYFIIIIFCLANLILCICIIKNVKRPTEEQYTRMNLNEIFDKTTEVSHSNN
jgi:hypothetical protein